MQYSLTFSSPELVGAHCMQMRPIGATEQDIWAVGCLFVYILTQNLEWFMPSETQRDNRPIAAQILDLRNEWVRTPVVVDVRTHDFDDGKDMCKSSALQLQHTCLLL